MQINLEAADINSIQSYSDSELKINHRSYFKSIIISREKLISDWPVSSVQDLNELLLEPMIALKPEVIIIGHNQPGQFLSATLVNYLAKQGAGVECMSIGAASRTFNLLLSEMRSVVLGILF